MGETETPNYYAVIPANVRYAKIPANAKLLYGEITALCQQQGFCWASDSYFKELYGVSRETANRWVKLLEKKGFIKIETSRSDKGTLRKLYLETSHHSDENVTPVLQKHHRGCDENVTQIIQVNNTSNISTNVDRPVAYGKPEINEIFDYWEATRGYKISSRLQANRNACNNLLKKYGTKGLMRLIDGTERASTSRFGPSISDIEDLQNKLNKLLDWGKKTTKQNLEVIS